MKGETVSQSNGRIRVERLSKIREFKNVEELVAEASGLVYGRPLAPIEQAIVSAAAERIGEPTNAIESRIVGVATKLRAMSRERPAPEPTPYDGDRAEAERRRDEAIAATAEVRERLITATAELRELERQLYKAREAQDRKKFERIEGRRQTQLGARERAEEEFRIASQQESRARARVNALALAADRHRALARYERDLEQAKRERDARNAKR